MNALMTLVWIEWKKTSSKVMLLFTLLLIGIVLIGLRDLTMISVVGQLGTIFFLAIVGVAVISYLSFQIGDDFRSDRFQILRLSPLHPAIHLAARLAYPVIVSGVFYLLLAALSLLAVSPFLLGGQGRLVVLFLSAVAYLLVAIILPGQVFILLLAMIMASFARHSLGKKLAMLVLAISTSLWMGDLMAFAVGISGKYLPVINLPLPEAVVRAPANNPIFNSGSWNIFRFDWGNAANSVISSDSMLMPLGGAWSVYLEPVFLAILFSLAGVGLISRIWSEVDL